MYLLPGRAPCRTSRKSICGPPSRRLSGGTGRSARSLISARNSGLPGVSPFVASGDVGAIGSDDSPGVFAAMQIIPPSGHKDADIRAALILVTMQVLYRVCIAQWAM